MCKPQRLIGMMDVLIASAKPQSVKGASHQPAFMSSRQHNPSHPENKTRHSASAPIAFLHRVYKIKVDKFTLLGNGHGSPDGSLLYLPCLTLPGN